MDPRREAILDAIIREYVETAEQVGSLTLPNNYDFPFSPATIRGEMAELEHEGYIMQPHTSAGRVPTEKGYKHFVKLILSESTTLAVRDEQRIRQQMLGRHMRYERLLDLAAKTLADATGNVGIVGLSGLVYSHGLANLFSQPEFKDSENVERAAEILDRMHELVHVLPPLNNPIVFVGSETPLGETSGCSLVVSGFETPYGGVGRLAVLGPTRMSYQKVISVVEEIKELLEVMGEKYSSPSS
jgi:transcriptional regulator of heat shock response